MSHSKSFVQRVLIVLGALAVLPGCVSPDSRMDRPTMDARVDDRPTDDEVFEACILAKIPPKRATASQKRLAALREDMTVEFDKPYLKAGEPFPDSYKPAPPAGTKILPVKVASLDKGSFSLMFKNTAGKWVCAAVAPFVPDKSKQK